jgi:hypothetical protein
VHEVFFKTKHFARKDRVAGKFGLFCEGVCSQGIVVGIMTGYGLERAFEIQ